MYAETYQPYLSNSTSVPALRPLSNYRSSQNDPQLNKPITMNRYSTNSPLMVDYNQNKLIKTSFKDNSGLAFESKRNQTANTLNFSSNLSQSTADRQGCGMTNSQMIKEMQQSANFQFKKTNVMSPKSPITDLKQGQRSYLQRQNSAATNRVVNVSNFQTLQKNNFTQNVDGRTSVKLEELQKKIKDLENQLKFQQKYANDLYKQNEDNINKLKNEKQQNEELKRKIISNVTEINANKNQIIVLSEQMKGRDATINNLKEVISTRERTIQEAIKQNNAKQQVIDQLNEKIANFNQIYRNQLYQDRIDGLIEQVKAIQDQYNSMQYEKAVLFEQIKQKNDKIFYLTIHKAHQGSPNKSADIYTSSINSNQMVNKMINTAFQESISHYQKDIEQLKMTIEKQRQDNLKQREQLSECRKQIEQLKSDLNFNELKFRTEIKNIMQENQVSRTDKINQIGNLTNRLKVIEEKYAAAVKQIRSKDQFLSQHLVGRAKQLQQKEYIETVINKYSNSFEDRISLLSKITALQKQLNKKG